MFCNYIKKKFYTKKASSTNSNNYSSTVNNFHTSINKKTALKKLAIDAQAFFTIISLDLTILASNKLEKAHILHAKWLYKDTEEVVEGFELVAR